ncbi:methyl-accepting chemotaxis protein [uncultured Gammaproteobacteria bacterium]
MGNTATLTTTRRLCIAVGGLAVVLAGLILISGEAGPVAVCGAVVGLVVAAVAVVLYRHLAALERTLTKALAVCRLAADNPQSRITDIDQSGVVGDLLRTINQALDHAAGITHDVEIANQSLREMAVRNQDQTEYGHLIAERVESAAQGDLNHQTESGQTEGNDKRNLERLRAGVTDLIAKTNRVMMAVEDVLSAITAGDLTQRIDADLAGSFGRLQTNTNAMAERLANTFADIANATANIMVATGEVAAGSTDMAEITSRQTSLLAQLTGTMTEITTLVSGNAEHADEGRRLALTAREASRGGAELATTAVIAIRKIEDSSRQVAEVVSEIDEISFQTNILALNAAVEAARLGDAGRGFAVVAAEVRQLAQRTAQANRDIKRMMAESGEHVAGGVERVTAVGAALAEIDRAITVVEGNTADIAQSSRRQTEKVAEVNEGIGLLEQSTHDVSALAQHGGHSAQTVGTELQALNNLIEFFGLDDGDNG